MLDTHLNYSQISVLVGLLKIENTQKITDDQRREIKKALSRVESGQYGQCQECNTKIYYKDLLKDPTLSTCRKCKNEKAVLAS